ncbi:MAG: SRPBCC domain-containing protein [Acidimicrobiia bacterium]|nr:SRPBCC domain-containing protein [Acidimicrobiia bacterium]
MRHELRTEIKIFAPPETVWDILTDLERYADWNPFIVEAKGNTSVGSKLVNQLQPPGGKAMTIKPVVTVSDTAQTLEWLGLAGIRGLFDGRHRFDLEATQSGGTRLVHSEKFSGIFVRPMRRMLDTQTKAGFEAMNVALKKRAESRRKS